MQVVRSAVFAMDFLESRRLLSTSIDANGVLTVLGTTGNDDISVGVSNGDLIVNVNGVQEATFDPADVTGVVVSGNDGDDSISLVGLPVSASVDGGNGNDTLVGGDGNDTLNGGNDNDSFFSQDGKADTLNGGAGTDTAVADNSLDSFTSIESGIPAPEITVTLGGTNVVSGASGAVDFGSVTAGQNGPTRTFVVTNDGTDTLTLGTVNVPTGFLLVDPLVGPLAPGASESFVVQVDTSVAGSKSGTITFSNSDADENPFTINVAATVTPVAPLLPEITVTLNGNDVADGSTNALTFGAVDKGATGPTLTFVVTNNGDGTLTLGSINVPAGYTVVDGLPGSLAAGASDSFTVRLDTSVVGVKSGDISISNNDTDEDPFNFAITGTVKAVVPPTTPNISVTIKNPAGPIDNGNSTVEYGNREVGAKGPTRTFRVTNSGTGNLNLGAITLPSGFTLIDPLASTIAPGATESFVVQLDTSGAAGTRTGFVSIPSNDPDSPAFTFRVTGTIVSVGTGPIPEITVNVSQSGQLRGVVTGVSTFGFGTAAQGSKMSRAARTFRVSNDGNADLHIGKINVPAGFKVLDGLTSTMTPGQVDNLVIALDTSGTTGAKSGNVTFSTNDANESAFSFGVSGTVSSGGVGSGAPEVGVKLSDGTEVGDGQASAVGFGSVIQGGAGATRTFRVRNDGNANLVVGSVSVPAGFTVVDGLVGPIAPGASESFVVRLDSTTVGTKKGNISFSTNDGNENPFNFPIVGVVNGKVTTTPGVTAALSGGTLTVNGTNAIDTISFGLSKSGLTVTGNGKTVSGSPFNGVKRIVVNSGDGDDRIVLGTVAISATLNGGNGNDTLIGGGLDDFLSGGAGNDVLDGGDGNDTLLGGIGNDVLTGGAGIDSMKGEDGIDTVNAADGLSDSLVDGGAGNDAIHKDRTDNATGT